MLFGLIGKTLTHSFSKQYFSDKFEREGLDHTYELFPLEKIEDYLRLIKQHANLSGLNVTIPYKESIIPFLDSLSPEAEKANAVNTILFRDGKSTGYNTDIYGFRNSIKPFLEPHHQRALILGTGGASKAVSYVFDDLGIDYYFVSRNKGNRLKCFSYDELNAYVMKSFPLIVNTTPVGMYPDVHSSPPVPYEHLTTSHFLYDLVYNPAETLFLKNGRSKGARTMNGLDMLKLQAERAWQLWNEKVKDEK